MVWREIREYIEEFHRTPGGMQIFYTRICKYPGCEGVVQADDGTMLCNACREDENRLNWYMQHSELSKPGF
jgi:hypothetical protein